MTLLSIAEIPIYCYAIVVSIMAINKAIGRGLTYGSSTAERPTRGKPLKKVLSIFQEGDFLMRLKGVTRVGFWPNSDEFWTIFHQVTAQNGRKMRGKLRESNPEFNRWALYPPKSDWRIR